MGRATDLCRGVLAAIVLSPLTVAGSEPQALRPVYFKVCDTFDAFAEFEGFRVDGIPFSAQASELFARCEVRAAFSQPRSLLDQWWREADERLPEHLERPGRLANWFEARIPGASSSLVHDRLAVELSRLFFVDEAFVMPEVVTPEFRAAEPRAVGLRGEQDPANDSSTKEDEATPNFRGMQSWFDPAPVGFGLEPLRALDGVRGDKVRVFHIEADWDVEHEDLQSIGEHSIVVPIPPGLEHARNHGTGVLGILFATDNGIGITGIADQAEGKLLCTESMQGTHNALVATIQYGAPGDVVVLIGQVNVGLQHAIDFVPVEFFRINFDAILTVTTQGFHVVEAAGNGENDLDDERFHGLFDRAARDSGAILVTGSEGAGLEPAWIANYGSRCDITGYGNDAVTTGYGGLFRTGDPRRAYEHRYSGTSAATAMMGGVAASVLGALRTQGLEEPSPAELRDLLRVGGTRIRGGLPPRPNLEAILRSKGLPRGLSTSSQHVRGSLSLEFPGFEGRPGFVLAGTASLAPTGMGGLLLDPDRMWPAFSLSALPTSYEMAVPRHPSLLGHDFFAQVFSRESGGGFEFSSTIEISVKF